MLILCYKLFKFDFIKLNMLLYGKNCKIFVKLFFEFFICVFFIIVRVVVSYVVIMDNIEVLLDFGVSSCFLLVVLLLKDFWVFVYKDYEFDVYKNRDKKINIFVLDNCFIFNEFL